MSVAQPSHPDSSRPTARWRPGVSVDVRNRYTRSWSPGFEIDAATSVHTDCYRVRRQSDGALLPTEIPADDLRPV